MNEKLDSYLCETYPKLFRERHQSMDKTCMCWGFSHDDGWYNIIETLCRGIQGHINGSRRERFRALRYNRVLRKMIDTGDTAPYIRHISSNLGAQWAIESAAKALANPDYKIVTEVVPQVTVVQVKEKFGTLRFYYNGGDSVIEGMVGFAEAMSACTCEQCGAPGVRRGGSWLRTLCDKHAEEQGYHLTPDEEKDI